MTNFNNFRPVDSVLVVKSSGVDTSVANDLSMPQGKSIAELLYEETNKNQESNTPQEEK